MNKIIDMTNLNDKELEELGAKTLIEHIKALKKDMQDIKNSNQTQYDAWRDAEKELTNIRFLYHHASCDNDKYAKQLKEIKDFILLNECNADNWKAILQIVDKN